MKIALSLITGLLILGYGIYKWLDIQEFGAVPDGAERQKFLQSPNFDSKNGTFTNIVPGDLRRDMKTWPLLQSYIFGKEIRTPTQDLPVVAPDFDQLLKKDGVPLKWIWLGHSTLYLNIQGTLVLVDPVFTSASPFRFMVTRFQAPLATVETMPKPDVIVISHDHYDHLDAGTMRFFAGTSAQFLVPLGLGSRLRSWGVDQARIQEMDWHESLNVQGVEFRAVPAQHFSGRGLFDANQTLWTGWIMKGPGLNIVYSGDTGYAGHFKDTGDRYGPFDLAFLECGQYNTMWRYVHMMPDEVLQAARDLEARNMSPVHWGMFNLSLHNWFDPIESITRLAAKAQLPIWHPKLGELTSFPGTPSQETWWRSHPDFIKGQSMVSKDQG